MAQTERNIVRSSLYDFGQPFNFDETVGRDSYIFVDDKMGRLYLSSNAAKTLGHSDGFPFSFHVAYSNGNIGLTSPASEKWADKRPARFDNRRYASARTFIKKLSVKPGKYIYVGFENQWYLFRPISEVRPV